MYNNSYHYRFSSVIEFYNWAHKLDPDNGNEREVKSFFYWLDGSWIGIPSSERGDKSLKEIVESRKYTYTKDLARIQRESESLVRGHSKRTYKWDELDGDDLAMERLMDHLPAMKKRTYTKGTKFGKFITLFFDISAHAGIGGGQLIWKTYTAVKLIKFFESTGIKTEVIIYKKSRYPGSMRDGSPIDEQMVEIVVKNFTDTLNIGLLNTTLTPWFMRYWILGSYPHKFTPSGGYGHPVVIGKEDLKLRTGINYIIISAYDCLSKEDSNNFINQVLNNEKTFTV